ncbi:MAG: ABC transporter ATP-binding protein [Planctomycetota bacterium]
MDLLELRDVVKAYDTPEGARHEVLRIPEFRLAARDQVALAGTSGSGKSTFLNVIAGMVRPDSGRVMLDGQEVTALPEAARDALRARTIGYVFQTFHLLGAYSALENVVLGMAFGPGPDPALARALLERLGLGERLHYRPHQLSVGQQQRVALARALANRPKLVLADEPTGNLDPGNAREALGLLRDLCTEHGAALLLVSHDPAVLAQFETRRDFDSINQPGTEVRA